MLLDSIICIGKQCRLLSLCYYVLQYGMQKLRFITYIVHLVIFSVWINEKFTSLEVDRLDGEVLKLMLHICLQKEFKTFSRLLNKLRKH